MSIVVLLSRDSLLLKQLQAAFARCAPQVQAVLADDPRAAQAPMAACWFPPADSLGRLPNLQVIHSVAAGIDHLEHDPACPDLPICRVVDPGHRQGMTEYLRWAVIHYHRGFDRVLEQQRERHWDRPLQRPARQFKVGIMGLGSLGSAIALDLAAAGYDVRGWARSPKSLAGVQTFVGPGQLEPFLDEVELLINLLPLTAETRGILGRDSFARLAHGAALVNVGRGGTSISTTCAKPWPAVNCAAPCSMYSSRNPCRPSIRCGPPPGSPSPRTWPRRLPTIASPNRWRTTCGACKPAMRC